MITAHDLIGQWIWSPETQTAMVIQSITFDDTGHSFAIVHDGLGERDQLGVHVWTSGGLTVGINENPAADPQDTGAGWVAYFLLTDVEGRDDLPEGIRWVFDGHAPSVVADTVTT